MDKTVSYIERMENAELNNMIHYHVDFKTRLDILVLGCQDSSAFSLGYNMRKNELSKLICVDSFDDDFENGETFEIYLPENATVCRLDIDKFLILNNRSFDLIYLSDAMYVREAYACLKTKGIIWIRNYMFENHQELFKRIIDKKFEIVHMAYNLALKKYD